MNLIIVYSLLRLINLLKLNEEEEDLTKIFIDEIYFKPPQKNYETNKTM